MTNPKKEACSCSECKILCHGNTGWFLPEQIAPAADHMGLSIPEFFKKYLIIEYWVGGENVLAPRRYFQEGQRKARTFDAFEKGRCNLLEEGGCALPLNLRPIECSTAKGCTSENISITRETIQKEWTGVCIEELICESE